MWDYIINVKWGDGEKKITKLCMNRELFDKVEYKGNFDESGKTTLEQPSELNGAIIYAYCEDNIKYLFINTEEATSDEYIFSNQIFGLQEMPSIVKYEPKDEIINTVDESYINAVASQIRIFDANIQVYNGEMWVTIGSVEEFIANDPLGDLIVTKV